MSNATLHRAMVAVRLPLRDVDRLDELASAAGITRSELIRRFICEGIARDRPPITYRPSNCPE